MTWDANGSPVEDGRYCATCGAWHEVQCMFMGIAVVACPQWPTVGHPSVGFVLKGEPGNTVRLVNVAPEDKETP